LTGASYNESSEVDDILLPLPSILTLRPGLIMPQTSDDLLFAGGDRPKANSLQYFEKQNKIIKLWAISSM